MRANPANAQELFEQHVADFNSGVTHGDFGPMVDRFDPDGEVVFAGAPFGPFRGHDAIRAAYRDQPPDDTITVLSSHTDGDTVHATFAWDANHGKKAGTMHLEVANSRIRRLVIALDSF
jgi:steroid Delta-isomerase